MFSHRSVLFTYLFTSVLFIPRLLSLFYSFKQNILIFISALTKVVISIGVVCNITVDFFFLFFFVMNLIQRQILSIVNSHNEFPHHILIFLLISFMLLYANNIFKFSSDINIASETYFIKFEIPRQITVTKLGKIYIII